MSTTSFKIGDRVRWTGKCPLSGGKTFATMFPHRLGRLGKITKLYGNSADIEWDGGQTATMIFFDNLELVEPPIAVGDRVVISLIAQRGWCGVVDEIDKHAQYPYLVRLDGETIRRCYSLDHLTKETKTVANIKTLAKTALDALLAPLTNESAKEQAVRRLGIAAALVTRGEAEKKKAKADLKELGVTRDEYAASTTETIFDSERYTVDAVTNAGSQRLDATALDAALIAEGVSAAKRTRIMLAASKSIKPSTSFKVESK